MRLTCRHAGLCTLKPAQSPSQQAQRLPLPCATHCTDTSQSPQSLPYLVLCILVKRGDVGLHHAKKPTTAATTPPTLTQPTQATTTTRHAPHLPCQQPVRPAKEQQR